MAILPRQRLLCLKILIPVIVIAVSGCVSPPARDMTPVLTSLPPVQQFLDEHPGTDVRIEYLTADQAFGRIDEIREECGEDFHPGNYYRGMYSDGGISLVVYVDSSSLRPECVAKDGEPVTGGRCGDGVCDFVSAENPFTCPEDCNMGAACVPVDEMCDGLDNDCDRLVDEECILLCREGETRACGPAYAGGICSPGISTCTKGTWSECQGEISPEAADVCGDGLDNDCDGAIDEAGCVAEPKIPCIDSDRGRDLFTRGTTKGYDPYRPDALLTETDRCSSFGKVTEFECTSGESNTITWGEHECPVGSSCEDGRCAVEDLMLACGDGACEQETFHIREGQRKTFYIDSAASDIELLSVDSYTAAAICVNGDCSRVDEGVLRTLGGTRLLLGDVYYNPADTPSNEVTVIIFEDSSYCAPDCGTAPVTGTLYVNSNPQGADIRVDGSYSGATPKTIYGLPAGSHELVIARAGYLDYTATVAITAGQTSAVSISLPVSSSYCTTNSACPSDKVCMSNTCSTLFCAAGQQAINHTCQQASQTLLGYLNVNSTPPGVNVYVDNVLKGQTNLGVAVPQGSHVVRLSKYGYLDYMVTVTVTAGQPAQVTWVMITSPCTDTDGGFTSTLKGTASDGKVTKTDYCLSPTTLVEHQCATWGSVFESNYTCPAGCQSGACNIPGSTPCTSNANCQPTQVCVSGTCSTLVCPPGQQAVNHVCSPPQSDIGVNITFNVSSARTGDSIGITTTTYNRGPSNAWYTRSGSTSGPRGGGGGGGGSYFLAAYGIVTGASVLVPSEGGTWIVTSSVSLINGTDPVLADNRFSKSISVTSVCGNSVCEPFANETPSTCLGDCPVCGDGICGATEYCAPDCGCIDTDVTFGGSRVDIQGTASSGTIAQADFCINSTALREFSCLGANIKSNDYDCYDIGYDICSSGRCEFAYSNSTSGGGGAGGGGS
ncbi:MAG: PEGA domain-containing protein [Candidatus Aenigmarchaeota archaeon]|nr:PEGA domain-containing protein [Candidatus Aenigmarchaeota archaeon]